MTSFTTIFASQIDDYRNKKKYIDYNKTLSNFKNNNENKKYNWNGYIIPDEPPTPTESELIRKNGIFDVSKQDNNDLDETSLKPESEEEEDGLAKF